MAAEDSVRAIDHVQRVGLSHTPIWYGIETAAMSWKRGAILIAAAAGTISEAAEDAVADILGVALEDASGVTGTAVPYVPALPHLTFEATLEDPGATHTLVQTDMFAALGFGKTAGGLWYIDEAEITAQAARIIEFVSPLGTNQARVRFMFLVDATVFSGPDSIGAS